MTRCPGRRSARRGHAEESVISIPVDRPDEGHESQAGIREHLCALSRHQSDDFRAASLARRLLRYSRGGGRVLDAGCGAGRMAVELLRHGCEVLAVDESETMVSLTNRTAGEAGFEGPVARTLPLERLGDLPRGSFDEIFCCDVLEHLEDDREAARRIRDLLKPGGRLVLTVPAWPFLFGERDLRFGHHRRYSRREVRSLCEQAGLAVDTIRWWNLSGFLLNAIGGRLLGLRFAETFRYDRTSASRRGANAILSGWFHQFENRVPVPVGLTLIAVARRDSGVPAHPPSGSGPGPVPRSA